MGAQKLKQPKELAPWDRRPWPRVGDSDIAALYASIGCALTAWERYESELAFLFSQFVSTGPGSIHPAMRAYCAVRTFQGRMEMLQAASESFFYGWGIKDGDPLMSEFKSMLNPSKRYSERRNDIAHGVVDSFVPEDFTLEAAQRTAGKFGHALFPTYGYFRERTPAGFPFYCYTSAEINYFREQFLSLMEPAHRLAAEISVTVGAMLEAAQEKAARGKLSPPSQP